MFPFAAVRPKGSLLAGPVIPGGGLGLWYADEYDSSVRPIVPNHLSAAPKNKNLLSWNRFFTRFWTQVSCTLVENAANDPGGLPYASSLNGSAGFSLQRNIGTWPNGTYTLAFNCTRNTGSDQTLKFGQFGGTFGTITATSAWQRFAVTFTVAGGTLLIQFKDVNGSTPANVLIANVELFAGSSDLGPEALGGHLLLGSTAKNDVPAVSGGVIDFTNPSTSYGLMGFNATTVFSTITVMAVVSQVGPDTSKTGAFFGDPAADAATALRLTAMTDRNTLVDAYFGGQQLNNSSIIFNGPLNDLNGVGWHVITMRYDGTNLQIWYDDVPLFIRATAISAPSLSYFVAGLNGSVNADIQVHAIAVWPSNLTDQQVIDANTVLRAHASVSGLTVTPPSLVMPEGDSITSGSQSSGAFHGYAWDAAFSKQVFGDNRAVSGNTLNNIKTRRDAEIAVIPKTKAGRKCVYTILNTNDCLGPFTNYSGSQSAYQTDFAAHLDYMRAGGFDKIVVGTILPRSNAGFNVARNSLNTWYATLLGTKIDAIADFAADATIGPDGANTNATYYAGDQVHPINAGYAIMQTIYQTAVNTVI